MQPHYSVVDLRNRPNDLETIAKTATYATSALNYRRQQRDFPGLSNPINLHQLEGQIEHEKNLRKINEYYNGKVDTLKILSAKGVETAANTKKMTALIHELNREGMPGFSL